MGMDQDQFKKEVIERLARIETTTSDDHKVVRGNGHPGLVERVSKLEQQLTMAQIQDKEMQGLLTSVVECRSDIKLIKTWKDDMAECSVLLQKLHERVTMLQGDMELLKSKSAWWKGMLGWIVAVVTIIPQLVFLLKAMLREG